MVVHPRWFGLSAQSAIDNAYIDLDRRIDPERVRAQFAGVVATVLELGVPLLAFPGAPGQLDGVFPNNVFGTIPGRFIVGSMRHPVRQAEAERSDVRQLYLESFGYELLDLTEREGLTELTGVLAIDRLRGAGIVGMSSRVDEPGATSLDDAFDLRATLRTPLVPGEYHLNIVLALLAGRAAVVHTPSFEDPAAVSALEQAYDGRVLHLTDAEKAGFAANCISVTRHDVLFSQTSLDALRPSAVARLESWGLRCHGVAVDEYEKAGGSLRCLIAEVF